LATNTGISSNSAKEMLTELVQTVLAAGLKSIEELDELLKPNTKAETRLRSYLTRHFASAKRLGADTVSMSDAFLARHIILLNLPKEESRKIITGLPIGSKEYTEDFLKVIDRSD
jgi:hypothetical protein